MAECRKFNYLGERFRISYKCLLKVSYDFSSQVNREERVIRIFILLKTITLNILDEGKWFRSKVGLCLKFVQLIRKIKSKCH